MISARGWRNFATGSDQRLTRTKKRCARSWTRSARRNLSRRRHLSIRRFWTSSKKVVLTTNDTNKKGGFFNDQDQTPCDQGGRPGEDGSLLQADVWNDRGLARPGAGRWQAGDLSDGRLHQYGDLAGSRRARGNQPLRLSS